MSKRPKNKLLALVLPVDLYEALERLARACDEPIEDCAEKLLADIVADDAAAHGETAARAA